MSRLSAAQRGLYRAQFGFVSDIAEEAGKQAQIGLRKAARTRAGRTALKGLAKFEASPVGRALEWYDRNVPGRMRPLFAGLEREVEGLPTPLEIPARVGLGIGGAAAGGLLGLAAAGPVGAIGGTLAGGTLAWGPASTKVWPYMLDPASFVGFGAAGTPLRTTARAAQLAEAAGNARRGGAAFRALREIALGVTPEQTGGPLSRGLWRAAEVVDWPENFLLGGTERMTFKGRTAISVRPGKGAVEKGLRGVLRQGPAGIVTGPVKFGLAPRGAKGVLPRTPQVFAGRGGGEAQRMMQDAIKARGDPVQASFLKGLVDTDRAALPPELRDLQPVIRLIQKVHGAEAVERLAEVPAPQAAAIVKALTKSALLSKEWVRASGEAWVKGGPTLWQELKDSLSLPYFQRAWEIVGVRMPFMGVAAARYQNLPHLALIGWTSRNALRFGIYAEANAVEGSLIGFSSRARGVPQALVDEIARTYADHPLLLDEAGRSIFRDATPESLAHLIGRQEAPSRRASSWFGRARDKVVEVLGPHTKNRRFANNLSKGVFTKELPHRWMKLLDDYARHQGATALGELLDLPANDAALAFRVLRALPDGPAAVALAGENVDSLQTLWNNMYERLTAEFLAPRPEVAAHLEAWKARGFDGTEGLVNVIRDAYQVAGVEETLMTPDMAIDALRAVAEGAPKAGTAEDMRRWRVLYERAAGLMAESEQRLAQGIHHWAAALPWEQQEAMYPKFEEFAAAELGRLDEAFQAATAVVKAKGDEMGLPWARTAAEVAGEQSRIVKDARRRLEERLREILKLRRGSAERRAAWEAWRPERDAIWGGVTKQKARLHSLRQDAAIRAEDAAMKTTPSERTVTELFSDIASGRWRSRVDDRLRREGEHLIERIEEFRQVAPEITAKMDEVDRAFVQRAVRLAGEMTPEQRASLRRMESEAVETAAQMSRDIALWGRDTNVMESFLRAMGMPFIGYELRRPVRFAVLAAERPSLILDMWRYHQAAEDYYVDLPGTPLDFSFSRMVGLGPVRNLLRPAFQPEHEGMLGLMESAGDWATKYGFYPMGLELATAAMMGASGDREGMARFLSVPPIQSALDAAGLIGVPGAAQVHEMFPDPFREQMVRAQLLDWGIDPDAATPEERDRAFKSTTFPSLMATQMGINRYRPEGLKRIWEARGKAAAKEGVPAEVVDSYVKGGRNPIYARDDKGVFYLDTAQQRAALREAAQRAGVSEDAVAASSRAWLHIRPKRQQRGQQYRQLLRQETLKLEESMVLPALNALERGDITKGAFSKVLRDAAADRQAIRANLLQSVGLSGEDLNQPREGLRPEDFAADAYYSIDLTDFNGNGIEGDDGDWEEFNRRRKAVLDQFPQFRDYILEEFPRTIWQNEQLQEVSMERERALRGLREFTDLPRWRGLDGEQSRRVDEMRRLASMFATEMERRTGRPAQSRQAKAQIWRIVGQSLKDYAASDVAPHYTPLLARGLRDDDRRLFRMAYRLDLADAEEREAARDPTPMLFAIAHPEIIQWYPSRVDDIVGVRRLRLIASELGIESHPGIAKLLESGPAGRGV